MTKDGVPDMVGTQGSRGSIAQRLMESRVYASFYEDLARPALMRLTTTRSTEEEMALATHLLELEPGIRLLDVACATGRLTRFFASAIEGPGASLVVGLDRSWPMLREATRQGRVSHSPSMHFVRSNAERMAVADCSFDRVHCAGALQVFDAPQEVLRECARVCVPGGLVVISTVVRGRGVVRGASKAVAGKMAGVRWFSEEGLKAQLRELGLYVSESHVAGSAITVQAYKSPEAA